MGKDKQVLKAILKDARNEEWQAKYTNTLPLADWYKKEYNDVGWQAGVGAFGSADMSHVKTGWSQGDIWIRRKFSIDHKNVIKKKLYLIYSHDDIFELYLNGQMLVNTGYKWRNYVVQPLDAEQVKSLTSEDNLITAHCHNTMGGAYVDFCGGERTARADVAGGLALAVKLESLAMGHRHRRRTCAERICCFFGVCA